MHPSDVPADIGKILDDTLKTFQDEYKDRLDTWRVIEGKAQTVLTTSGAFLGGVFALAQRLPTQFQLDDALLVGVSVAALSAAVVHSLLSLRPRTMVDPPTGTAALSEISTIEARGLITNAHVINMKRDTAELWRQCVESLQAANAAKAKLVRRGQLLIGVGALSVSAIILLLLFGHWI